MKQLHFFLSLVVLSTLVLTTSCFSPRKKKEETKEKEASFNVISTFEKKSKLSGMTDNGLCISDDGRLFAVINEGDAYLWTALSNGDDAKSRLLHGSVTYPGDITMNMGNGLVKTKEKLYGVTEKGGGNGGGKISIESVYLIN
jgi:hypothetical protein